MPSTSLIAIAVSVTIAGLMKLRSLIQVACFAIIVMWISLYLYSRFPPTSETGVLKETALLIPLVAALALLSTLNLLYFSSRTKSTSPGLGLTVSWFFFLASVAVLLLNFSHIWFITPMRVVFYFVVVLVLSFLLSACAYLRFGKPRDV